MPFDGNDILADVKAELRVTHTTDDAQIVRHINEAAESLAAFLANPITEAAALTLRQRRYIYICVALSYIGPDADMERAQASVLNMIRED